MIVALTRIGGSHTHWAGPVGQGVSAEKVSQAPGSPLRNPVRNQRRRCSEVPCVNESGLTLPPARR